MLNSPHTLPHHRENLKAPGSAQRLTFRMKSMTITQLKKAQGKKTSGGGSKKTPIIARMCLTLTGAQAIRSHLQSSGTPPLLKDTALGDFQRGFAGSSPAECCCWRKIAIERALFPWPVPRMGDRVWLSEVTGGPLLAASKLGRI